MPDEFVALQRESHTANDIVYDDDSLEAILSGQRPAPTPASIFLPARKLLEALTSGETWVDRETVLSQGATFLLSAPPLTPALYEVFCRICFAAAEGAALTDEVTVLLQEMVRVCLAREAKGELPELLSLIFPPESSQPSQNAALDP